MAKTITIFSNILLASFAFILLVNFAFSHPKTKSLYADLTKREIKELNNIITTKIIKEIDTVCYKELLKNPIEDVVTSKSSNKFLECKRYLISVRIHSYALENFHKDLQMQYNTHK